VKRPLWTIGHSTRAIDEFLGLLAGSSIRRVADVRKIPGSARHPQFNADALASSLSAARISYRHYPSLGGRRGKRAAGSPNTAWRVVAFNAFADHMATPEFAAALDELTGVAELLRTAVMCSEAVPWRCHRRLIADALVVRGWTVLDILSPTKVEPHRLTPFARVNGLQLTYPAEPLFDGGAGAIPDA
jgi:uncharacterized protein (DUF488 family)